MLFQADPSTRMGSIKRVTIWVGGRLDRVGETSRGTASVPIHSAGGKLQVP